MNMSDPMFQTLTLALPMIAIFYFLLWRPQQQRAKQLRQMIENLRRGDTVALLSNGAFGGLHGRLLRALAEGETK